MLNNSTTSLGLGLGDKHSHLAILDQHGDLIEETCLPTTKASFQHKFSTLQPCRIAMEVGGSLALVQPLNSNRRLCWQARLSHPQMGLSTSIIP